MTRAATMFFATPLRDPSGAVIAVLTLRFDPVRELGRMVCAGQIGASGEPFAFDERTEELRKVVQAVEQSPLCVVITELVGNIEHVNPTFTKVTGYEAHEVIGKNPRVLKSGETPPDLYDSLWETILAGKVWHSEIRNRRKNGEFYWGGGASPLHPLRTTRERSLTSWP